MKWWKGVKKNNNLSFWKRVRFKYKLSFINENTLEEVWSFRLSLFSAFVTLTVYAISLITITALIIIMTPIRNYLLMVTWTWKCVKKSWRMLCGRILWSG